MLTDDAAFWHACSGTPIPVRLEGLEPLVCACELVGFRAWFDDGSHEIVKADEIRSEVRRRIDRLPIHRWRRVIFGIPNVVAFSIIEDVAVTCAYRKLGLGVLDPPHVKG